MGTCFFEVIDDKDADGEDLMTLGLCGERIIEFGSKVSLNS